MEICIPIKQNKSGSILRELKKAQKDADVIEIWFDEISDLTEENLRKIDKINKRPLLYKTTRPDLEKISRILKIVKNIAYLDFDIDTNTALINKVKNTFSKVEIIISYHNFRATPPGSELKKIIQTMIAKKADILKIATRAKSREDSLGILALLSHISKKHKTIFLCMGRHGRLTRITGHLLGNYLMYAPMGGAHFTAPGQLTIYELKEILKSIN